MIYESRIELSGTIIKAETPLLLLATTTIAGIYTNLTFSALPYADQAKNRE
jgi:hypothetical protein